MCVDTAILKTQEVPAIYIKPKNQEKKMKSFPSFVEYLNAKGKVVENPETKEVPDYEGPDEKFPPSGKVPYNTPVANKKPEEGEGGLADMGDSKLKYEPTKGSKYEVKKDVMKEYMDEKGKVLERGREDVKGEYKIKVPASPAGGNSKPYIGSAIKPGEKSLGEVGDKDFIYEPDTKNSKKVNTKTEGFLNKTKGMSLSEFTKYMLKECGCGQVEGDDLPYVTAYTTGKFQPHPPEVIRYISVLADKNNGILENLVGQMISMGYLNKLLKAVFEHPQAYEELVSLLGDDNDGPTRCKSFAGAMNNSYSKFLSDQENMYESVSSPIGFEDEMGELDDSEEDHEGSEDDEEGGEEDYEDHEGSEDDEEGGEEDYEDHEDSEDDEEVGEEDYEDHEDSEDDQEDSEESLDDSGEHAGDGDSASRKLKRKFAHNHLLDAMSKYNYMTGR